MDLEFVDEEKFRKTVQAYFTWIAEQRKSFRSNATYAGDETEVVVAENNIFGDKFHALIRKSDNILSKWTNLSLDDDENNITHQEIFSALTCNRSLLLKILDHADNPKLVALRRKRELIHRGLSSRRVFIIHGHDLFSLEDVRSFLVSINLEPVILHEQPNLGKTIIEKFEHNADVGFAIAMLTPDDLANSQTEANDRRLNTRARQNVILELGYFIAKLGRNRVCALKKGEVELPSDILGVVFTEFDPLGAWKLKIAKELMALGYNVNMRKIHN